MCSRSGLVRNSSCVPPAPSLVQELPIRLPPIRHLVHMKEEHSRPVLARLAQPDELIIARA